ncbi:MAG TPA: hypothetical protein VG538_13670 [Vicinamibacterales bacterium]|nr:hypothetical protein [Vicinamibacterales bacterium]
MARSVRSSRQSRIRVAVIGGAALALSGAAMFTVVNAAAPDTDLHALVQSALHFSDDDLNDLDRGRAVVKTLPSDAKREMATVGGIRIDGASMPGFVEQFQTLQGFRRSQFVLQIARFSDEPRIEDLDGLTIEREDLDALRRCRVGSCDVQLAASEIEHFARDVDWRAADAADRAAAVYKRILLDRVRAHRHAGLAAVPPYADDDTPMPLAEAIAALVDARPSLLDRTPVFADYIRHFPSGPPAGTTDFYYWSKEAFGFKPVVGLNHVSVHRTADARVVIITTTQIYASHYLHGQFAVNALVQDATPTAFYWLYANRARIDRLDGFFSPLVRPIIQRRARNGLEKSLEQTKARLESGRAAGDGAAGGHADGGG